MAENLPNVRVQMNRIGDPASPPGMITIGHEHMNLRAHGHAVRRAITRSYPRLDALVVLSEHDRADYERLLTGRTRLYRIPHMVDPSPAPTIGVGSPRPAKERPRCA